jgi:Zn-dependent protease with chaperone function
MARCFDWVSGLFLAVWAALSIPRFLVVSGLTVLLYYWMEKQAMADWIPNIVVVAIIAPSLIMAFSQFGALFRYWRRAPPSGSLGCVVDRTEAPELYEFVEDIARRVGVAAPAWLAVTADTDFSVTDGPVLLPDTPEPLEGGCMSLSLPLLRVLTSEEAAGIIAHELGHLDDPVSQAKTVWGPPYGALLSEMMGETVWGLSANWHLGIVPALFSGAVAETLHQSEANADAATLQAARPETAVQAFLKSVVMEEATGDHANLNFERLEKGVVLDNLSVEAADLTRKALADVDPADLVARIRDEYQGDLMEPSIEQRIGNFDFALADAAELLARHAGQGEPARVGDLTQLEVRATRNVHRFQQVLAGEPGPLSPEEVENMAVFLAG